MKRFCTILKCRNNTLKIKDHQKESGICILDCPLMVHNGDFDDEGWPLFQCRSYEKWVNPNLLQGVKGGR